MMDENTEKVLSKLADKGPGWTILAMLIQQLPRIIVAIVGTAGAASLLKAVLA
ncbi:hypothetical protein [Novosphingobium sp.]|jgi:hypothetical protein|uniref:hypothetical protein n=1 Tax=Novosphingobium sp. TaxID=1874826 RepID=UPI002FE0A1F9